MGAHKTNSRKIQHEAFQITANFEIWIEHQNDDRFHVYHKLCTAGSKPVEVADYADQPSASAHASAIKTLFGPNIIEGTETVISSSRKGSAI